MQNDIKHNSSMASATNFKYSFERYGMISH